MPNLTPNVHQCSPHQMETKSSTHFIFQKKKKPKCLKAVDRCWFPTKHNNWVFTRWTYCMQNCFLVQGLPLTASSPSLSLLVWRQVTILKWRRESEGMGEGEREVLEKAGEWEAQQNHLWSFFRLHMTSPKVLHPNSSLENYHHRVSHRRCYWWEYEKLRKTFLSISFSGSGTKTHAS